MMKFLICGLGSIGQRHIRIIRSVTNSNATIAAFRSRNLDIVISDRLEASFGSRPEDHYGIQCFYDLEEALAWEPDAVFVTNPISMHIETAIAAARAGSHIFIEKPLALGMEGVAELMEIVKEKQLVCMVGYQHRYHPACIQIKSLLEHGTLGNLISADLHFGEWLPGMHPYEDYRESHAARKNQGGGVILCLSHEIDMANWLFGKPTKIFAMGGHLSDLEIDVEDTADITMSCISGSREYPVHIHLDFLQKPARRYIHVVGELGSVIYDYSSGELEIRLLSGSETERISFAQFQRNEMFMREVSLFIEYIEDCRRPRISLDHELTTLMICLAAKRSLVTNRAENIC